MVSAGAGEAFDHVGMNLPDITVLGKRGEDEKEEAEDEAILVAVGADEDLVTASPCRRKSDLQPQPGKRSKSDLQPQAGKKNKWVDIGSNINAARRNLRSRYNTLSSQYMDVANKLRKAIAEIKGLPPSVSKLFVGELIIGESRLKGCEFVMGTSDLELAAYITGFYEDFKNKVEEVAKSAGDSLMLSLLPLLSAWAVAAVWGHA
jgi:hypothetical protein